MRRLLRKSALAGLIAMAVMASTVNPAGASAAGVVVAGGSMSADLLANPTTPVPNSMTLTGTFAGVLDTTPATCDVTANLSGTDSLLTGSGSGSLSCNGAGVSVSCSAVVYVRVGAQASATGNCSGTVSGALTVECVVEFIPPNTIRITCVVKI